MWSSGAVEQWSKKKGQYEIRWADEPNRKLPVGTVVRKRAAQPGKYDTQWSVGLFEVLREGRSGCRRGG